MKSIDEVVEEYRAKYGELDALTEEAIRMSEEYLREHPEERGKGVPLMDWYKRETNERKPKKNKAS